MSYNEETKMYDGYIYKIWNDVNNKLYIGQTTKSIEERWHGHMSSAINEKRSKSALYSAMKKYGRDKFHIETIDTVSCYTKEELIDTLNILEEKYIQEYDTLTKNNHGYNFEPGGKNKIGHGRIVDKYDINLNYIQSYDSISEAGRLNNIDDATIWAVCNHDYFTAAGFVWAYHENKPR